VIDCVEGQGWVVKERQLCLSPNGARVVGALQLEGDIQAPPGMGFALAFSASNNQREAVRLFAGGSVFVCSNGMITGERILRRKHTVHLDLASEVNYAIEGFRDNCKSLTTTVAQMQETKLNQAAAGLVLHTAKEQGIMGPELLFNVAMEYMRPRHAEHGTGTKWAMYNAFTEIVKATSPHNQLQRIREFTGVLQAV
jgi:hypothetical protein